MCGEQKIQRPGLYGIRGSPPRVRGTVFVFRVAKERAGITPACAGNSSLTGDVTGSATDHPRVCGEQYQKLGNCWKAVGSPPRVRGTERGRSDMANECRITPACAGNSDITGLVGLNL